MSPRPVDWHSLRSILVFRALFLGDLLCIVPALRALRAAAPRARITLAGLPWASQFQERFAGYVDEHMVFPGFPGLPEQAPALADVSDWLERLRARQFDLALQWHGSGAISNILLALTGPGRMAGFYPRGGWCPEPDLFMPWVEREHEALRYLALLRALGVPLQGEALEFPVRAADHEDLLTLMNPLPAAGSYACIHAGARLPSRRWPAQRFAQVADQLAGSGLQIVLTGAANETALVREVRQQMRAPALDLCGKTGLGSLGALLSAARLLVCNDTGVAHMAAACATPSVTICSGADPGRWAPLDGVRHRVLSHAVACRPCAHAVCPIGHPCATGVTVEMVMREAHSQLAANRGQASCGEGLP